MKLTPFRGNPLFRNLISVEAAVWPETFDPEGPVAYNTEQIPAHNITYTMDALKEHSWQSWFNQSAHPAKTSLGGQLHHSYVPDDYALEWLMRLNDDIERGSYAAGGSCHYYRSTLQNYPPRAPEWRAPKGEKQSHVAWGPGRRNRNVLNRLHDRIPTLMLQGHRNLYYGYKDLNLPVGAMEHPLATASENATKNGLGWRKKKHSDFAVGESGDANADMWFPIIWNWYEQFIQPAICINEE